MQDRMKILKAVVDAHGIRFTVLEKPYEGMDEFDEGLRRQLYQDYDYTAIIRQIETNCQENKVYLVKDVFGLYYIIFGLPESGAEEKKYVLIGPYLEKDYEPDPMDIVKNLELELYHVQILKTFYQGIGAMLGFEGVILSLVKLLFAENDYEFVHSGMNLVEMNRNMRLRIREEKRLPMEMVEERYRCENQLLDAVEQGDETKAMLAMAALGRFSQEKRSTEHLRNDKNSLIIFNVLLRKAVEKAGVHPYYIDELSSSFARRIEAARNSMDIMQINREFIRKYCLLVRNYAMRGYSDLVNKCVNYIEFNLTEELSLNDLSARFIRTLPESGKWRCPMSLPGSSLIFRDLCATRAAFP